jgi:uncharacterized protein YndB with AHSA1/START domain
MSSAVESIEINASPQRVFPYLVEPARLKLWVGGFVESRPVGSSTPGVGTKSIDIVRDNGREIAMETEIHRYEPPHRLEVGIRGPGLTAVSDYRLEGSDTTILTHRQDAHFRGVIKLLAPFLGRAGRRRMREDLARLKAAVEASDG